MDGLSNKRSQRTYGLKYDGYIAGRPIHHNSVILDGTSGSQSLER
ncbi:Uncharacterised protein [Yersinia similis]|uniref:Uncharacterized protein n=1 Tax=Yersinia similis TaxID=367190 RepID=A0A0T9QTD3_9GAMM|nr:Uncharacterised protein [Yersinia similis]CNB19972.1 Uncharacterised protein [Yersinia similis]CNE35858.1 Uncharacterised protein [Yersinia similis]CNG05893.1 Uncharacterised protein [Yersinia similis]CNI27482.1 Uncharacterised protein [Yersinia similis]